MPAFGPQAIRDMFPAMMDICSQLILRWERFAGEEIDFLHNLCDEIVQERRKHPNDVNDLLNQIINGKEPETTQQLSDENIHYQMLTFLVAELETTSGLLSFTMYYLLKNPQTLQKAQAEVDQHNEITVDVLSKLKYIDAVLKETLRLQPTAPAFVLESKHFNIEFVDPSYDLCIQETLTMKPDGFKIRVRPRQHLGIALNVNVKQSEKIPEKLKQQVKTENLRPMSILFGSNSGSCQSFADTLTSEAPLYDYNATVATLDSAVEYLPNDRPIIIITASYEDKPCENTKQFVAYLESKPKLEINYAVFGADHHDWIDTYQKIPTFIDEMIENAGGTRINERGAGDAAGDFFGAFEIEASEIGPMKLHLEIQLPKGQTYHTEDYLAVLSTNPIEIVYRVLKQFNLSSDTRIKIVSSTDTFFSTNYPVSAFDILRGYVELAQPISKRQIVTRAGLCKNEKEQISLINLDGDAYEKEILEKRISIFDILELYPSCELPFPQYLRILPSLPLSGLGRYYGIASNYLGNLKEGDRISCSVRTSNVRFHPPEDTKIPIVMTAAGTGIAPFRGFIQERVAQFVCGREIGRTILYYGCRSDDDFLYSDELNKWLKLGAVEVKSVFSRQNNNGKKYVQDLLWEDRNEIANLYCNSARFYTCGSANKLGVSVKACFIKIIAEMQQCNEEEAKKILEKLSIDRFSVDFFA
ncbi:unnamed protein product [Rotaria sordida]|uniref:Flavodoxin-like domain-containing protein n=1 Tax=Rotaria sordida TaxID=392033 RepID=A0A814LXK3_9BILA|nr:unnamed protein product [Rotaria sordida]